MRFLHLEPSFAQELPAAETLLTDQSVFEGKAFESQLARLDSQAKTLSLAIRNRRREFPLAHLIRWGALKRPAPRSHLLLLSDGSQLIGNPASLQAGMLQIESYLFGSIAIPRNQIKALLLTMPSSPGQFDQRLANATDWDLEQDEIVLLNGDRLRGNLLEIRSENEEPNGPTWLQPAELLLVLESEVGKFTVPFSQVQSVHPRTLPTASTYPSPLAWVGFTDGTLLQVSKLSLGDSGVLLQSTALPSLQKSQWRVDFPEALCFVQPWNPRGGLVRYLSDERPVAYRHLPFLSLSRAYQQDRNLLGRTLRVSEKRFLKGIGVPSASVLLYRLDSKVERFEAELAIDDAAGPEGSVQFQVVVDRQLKYQSPIIRTGDRPVPISIDIKKARQLTLLVRYAERGDAADYANWLDARLIRSDAAEGDKEY
ncbi:Hypothetical protein PBC10988_13250 [Planctomycetales bacterium 10988]|nr:Hypothetical protein PBC10988_13250 [Planctomycetales bacterium 10988]